MGLTYGLNLWALIFLTYHVVNLSQYQFDIFKDIILECENEKHL